MAARLRALASHVLPPHAAHRGEGGEATSHPTSATAADALSPPLAPLNSPTGKTYLPGTAVDLRGNMEPVLTEVTGDLLCIFGSLPPDLDGQFIRVGPNPQLNLDGKPYHAFNGDGMVHAADIQQGRATYKNRWIRTARFEKERQSQRTLKMKDSFGPDGVYLGQANTALVYHSDKLMALLEVDRPYVLDPPSFDTLGPNTYGGKLSHGMTAHPKICPRTGEMIFFGYELMQPLIHYAVASASGELVRSFDIPTQCGKPVMMHDMAITENYSIILEFPLCFDMSLAMSGGQAYAMDIAQPSRFGILRRHAESAAETRWFEGKTMMAFHIANAWEEGRRVKLIGCPNPDFTFDSRRSGRSMLYEWIFDLDTGATTEREIEWGAPASVEFPVVHPGFVGSPTRYVYTAQFTDGIGLCDSEGYSPFHAIRGVNKHDLQTGRVCSHVFLGGRFGGESVFVPRSGGREDAGYLVTFTFNAADSTSELYIVDASSLGAEPVAILKTPQRVPFGFHGLWLPRAGSK